MRLVSQKGILAPHVPGCVVVVYVHPEQDGHNYGRDNSISTNAKFHGR
jgi:hypothetical protein